VTPEVINFMAKHGRGLICVPLPEERCDELNLELMVNSNTALHETAFTVSVDLLGHGCTTGISSHDRSKTVQALIDPNTKPAIRPPGSYISASCQERWCAPPRRTYRGGDRSCPLSWFSPPHAGVLVEILNEDGTMARLPELKEVAKNSTSDHFHQRSY